ncbi:MAG: hypothetical protein ACFFCQ_03725 [Promethearchaeota archaeon]
MKIRPKTERWCPIHCKDYFSLFSYLWTYYRLSMISRLKGQPQDIGNTMTFANPEVVEALIEERKQMGKIEL